MTDYSKSQWAAGDVITSAKLNNIENGIDIAADEIAAVSGAVDNLTEAVTNLGNDTVLKSVTKTGSQAQSSYNLVSHKITSGNVTSMVWNEESGGGVQIKNTDANVIAFIGVNNGHAGDNIWAQFYGKYITTNNAKGQVANAGTRVNFTNDGVYYTRGKTNGSFTADDELVTKATVNSLEARIAALEAKVAALEGNS